MGIGLRNEYETIMARVSPVYELTGDDGERVLVDHAEPATAEDVRKVEEELRRQLPADYREFVVQYGNTSFEGASYLGAGVEVFFGIRANGDEDYDLLSRWRDAKGAIPARFIPISEDAGGNLICMAVSGDDSGTIYWCDHEDPEYREFLSPDFDTFIRGIEVED